MMPEFYDRHARFIFFDKPSLNAGGAEDAEKNKPKIEAKEDTPDDLAHLVDQFATGETQKASILGVDVREDVLKPLWEKIQELSKQSEHLRIGIHGYGEQNDALERFLSEGTDGSRKPTFDEIARGVSPDGITDISDVFEDAVDKMEAKHREAFRERYGMSEEEFVAMESGTHSNPLDITIRDSGVSKELFGTAKADQAKPTSHEILTRTLQDKSSIDLFGEGITSEKISELIHNAQEKSQEGKIPFEDAQEQIQIITEEIKNGVIEYLSDWQEGAELIEEELDWIMTQTIDTDGDGYLSPEEFESMIETGVYELQETAVVLSQFFEHVWQEVEDSENPTEAISRIAIALVDGVTGELKIGRDRNLSDYAGKLKKPMGEFLHTVDTIGETVPEQPLEDAPIAQAPEQVGSQGPRRLDGPKDQIDVDSEVAELKYLVAKLRPPDDKIVDPESYIDEAMEALDQLPEDVRNSSEVREISEHIDVAKQKSEFIQQVQDALTVHTLDIDEGGGGWIHADSDSLMVDTVRNSLGFKKRESHPIVEGIPEQYGWSIPQAFNLVKANESYLESGVHQLQEGEAYEEGLDGKRNEFLREIDSSSEAIQVMETTVAQLQPGTRFDHPDVIAEVEAEFNMIMKLRQEAGDVDFQNDEKVIALDHQINYAKQKKALRDQVGDKLRDFPIDLKDPRGAIREENGKLIADRKTWGWNWFDSVKDTVGFDYDHIVLYDPGGETDTRTTGLGLDDARRILADPENLSVLQAGTQRQDVSYPALEIQEEAPREEQDESIEDPEKRRDAFIETYVQEYTRALQQVQSGSNNLIRGKNIFKEFDLGDGHGEFPSEYAFAVVLQEMKNDASSLITFGDMDGSERRLGIKGTQATSKRLRAIGDILEELEQQPQEHKYYRQLKQIYKDEAKLFAEVSGNVRYGERDEAYSDHAASAEFAAEAMEGMQFDEAYSWARDWLVEGESDGINTTKSGAIIATQNILRVLGDKAKHPEDKLQVAQLARGKEPKIKNPQPDIAMGLLEDVVDVDHLAEQFLLKNQEEIFSKFSGKVEAEMQKVPQISEADKQKYNLIPFPEPPPEGTDIESLVQRFSYAKQMQVLGHNVDAMNAGNPDDLRQITASDITHELNKGLTPLMEQANQGLHDFLSDGTVVGGRSFREIESELGVSFTSVQREAWTLLNDIAGYGLFNPSDASWSSAEFYTKMAVKIAVLVAASMFLTPAVAALLAGKVAAAGLIAAGVSGLTATAINHAIDGTGFDSFNDMVATLGLEVATNVALGEVLRMSSQAADALKVFSQGQKEVLLQLAGTNDEARAALRLVVDSKNASALQQLVKAGADQGKILRVLETVAKTTVDQGLITVVHGTKDVIANNGTFGDNFKRVFSDPNTWIFAIGASAMKEMFRKVEKIPPKDQQELKVNMDLYQRRVQEIRQKTGLNPLKIAQEERAGIIDGLIEKGALKPTDRRSLESAFKSFDANARVLEGRFKELQTNPPIVLGAKRFKAATEKTGQNIRKKATKIGVKELIRTIHGPGEGELSPTLARSGLRSQFDTIHEKAVRQDRAQLRASILEYFAATMPQVERHTIPQRYGEGIRAATEFVLKNPETDPRTLNQIIMNPDLVQNGIFRLPDELALDATRDREEDVTAQDTPADLVMNTTQEPTESTEEKSVDVALNERKTGIDGELDQSLHSPSSGTESA